MHLVIDVDGVRREVELAQAAEAATLIDLVQHAGDVAVRPDETLWIDDTPHDAGDLVRSTALLEGTRIGRTPANHSSPISGWAASLSGGMNAGRTVAIPQRRPLLIGRSPQADLTIDSPSASWSHASIEHAERGLLVRDSGSTNGTYVDGVKVEDEDGVLVTDQAVVVVGGAAITLWRGGTESLAPAPGTLHNLTHSATVPFNRPPRAGLSPAPEPIESPTRKDPPPPARFGIAAIVAPLLMAVVMVMVMRDLRFALFALLSPVMAVGTTVEQKRRRKKDVQESDTAFDSALEEFRSDLDAAAAIERERRRELAPDPALTLRRADLPTTRLWQRRPGAEDFLILHAGVGNVGWEPRLTGTTGRKSDDEVQKLLDDAVLPAAPVEIDLTGAGVVGIVGDRDGCLAVARSLLCQAATHCGPADLTVGVFCDPGRDESWSWAGWLPHVRRMGDGTGGRWISTERGRSEGMLRSLRDGIDGHPTRSVLLVLDSDVLTEGRDAPARQLLGYGRPLDAAIVRPSGERAPVQVSGIVIAANEEALPASCTTVIEVREDAHGRVHRPGDRTSVEEVVLAGITVPTAQAGAGHLARFDDPELSIPGGVLPSLVRLPPLLGIDEISPAAIRRIWGSSTRVATPLGVGESGVFGIDLVRDGPHGLVGGTTGSGKSEFLRSMVAGLAARNDPTRLTFILIDFKGGAAFKTCERLPHTIGTVSNLDEQLADRALTALEAELRYRQEVFAQAGEGIDNLDAYLATEPAEPMPRLLLVIDEFAMLAKDYPDVLKSLVSVAAVGRTLGVHMILATQRPAGVVNDDILANTNLRVALRVQSREDSTNVIGVQDASAIGRTQWGRAYVKLGQDDITPVQTALVTGRVEAATSKLVDVHPVRFDHDEQKADTPGAGRRCADRSGPADRRGDRGERGARLPAAAAGLAGAAGCPRPVAADRGRIRIPIEDRRAAAAGGRRTGRFGGPDRGRRRSAAPAPAAGRLGPGSGQPAAARHPGERDDDDSRLGRTDARGRVLAGGAGPARAGPRHPRSGAAGRSAAHRRVRRCRHRCPGDPGPLPQAPAPGAGPAQGRRGTVPADGGAGRRAGGAARRVRRLRGAEAAGGLLPGLRRRSRRRDPHRGRDRSLEGDPDRDRGGHHAALAVPAGRPVRLQRVRGAHQTGAARPSRAAACWPRPSCMPTSERRPELWPRRWPSSPNGGGTSRPSRRWWVACRRPSPWPSWPSRPGSTPSPGTCRSGSASPISGWPRSTCTRVSTC